jgi:hypothetical protein
LTDGPLGVGTRFSFVRQFLGKKMESSNEFTTYQPNEVVTFKIPAGPMTGEASYSFEPSPGGTRVTSTIHFENNGFTRLAGPLVAASLRREMAAGFVKLKELLESQEAAA